jgi:hypothetical protein
LQVTASAYVWASSSRLLRGCQKAARRRFARFHAEIPLAPTLKIRRTVQCAPLSSVREAICFSGTADMKLDQRRKSAEAPSQRLVCCWPADDRYDQNSVFFCNPRCTEVNWSSRRWRCRAFLQAFLDHPSARPVHTLFNVTSRLYRAQWGRLHTCILHLDARWPLLPYTEQERRQAIHPTVSSTLSHFQDSLDSLPVKINSQLWPWTPTLTTLAIA